MPRCWPTSAAGLSNAPRATPEPGGCSLAVPCAAFWAAAAEWTSARTASAAAPRSRGVSSRSILKLPAALAIERGGAAAPPPDGQCHQPPQQRVLVAAVEPGEAVAPVLIEREIAHLDGDRRREEAGEQS